MAKLSTYQTLASVTSADFFVFLRNGTDVAKAAYNTVLAAFGIVPGSSTTPADFKDSVDVATTANITLSGEQTIDGVLTSASRVLVKNQTTGSQNGIYTSAAGAWSRVTDADASAEVTSGMQVLVLGGTVSGSLIYALVTPDPITLGTTALTFQAVAIASPAIVGKTVAGTTYTTILTDANKRLNCTNAGTKTITVARQATVNAAVNTEIEVFNAGAGLLTLAPDTGVTLNSFNGVLTVPQYSCVKLKKRANPNTWDVTDVTLTQLQGTGLAADSAGFRGIPQTTFSAATTIAALHEGRDLIHPASDANARTLTIDSNANLALPVGFTFSGYNDTSQAVTIAITSDTLVWIGTGGTGSRTVAQYGSWVCRKIDTTRWVISGVNIT